MQFGFVLTWIYLVFMQWIVVWGGDLPDEIHWYIVRATGGWQYLLWLLLALQVAAFAGSLSRPLKRSHDGLTWLAGIVLAGHLADVFWRIRPPLFAGGPPALWHDAVAWIGVGGLWLALFLSCCAGPIGWSGGSGRPPMAKARRHPETRDVQPRVLLAFGGGLLVFLALAAFCIKLVFNTTPSWLPPPENASPEAPDLQSAPRQDLVNFRAEEDRQLKMLGWVDRSAGIARIPIDDAMWAVVNNGLPDWSQPDATAPEPGDCNLLAAAVPRTSQAQNCQQQSGEAGR
ncbi:hypothetical protein ACVOMV_16415 [Mesorhizobium atlanticum]